MVLGLRFGVRHLDVRQTIGFPFPLATAAMVGDAFFESFSGVADIADPRRFVVLAVVPDIARPLLFRGAMMAMDVHAAALRASSRTRRWRTTASRWCLRCVHRFLAGGCASPWAFGRLNFFSHRLSA